MKSLVKVDVSKTNVVPDPILENRGIALARELFLTEQKDSSMMTGWLRLPEDLLYSDLYAQIINEASRLSAISDYVICLGIGGSYLGAKAVISTLSKPFISYQKTKVIFAGFNLSSTYLESLLDFLKGKKFSIVCISKSGSTIETSIAYRLLQERLHKELSDEEVKRRISIITDPHHGLLHDIACKEGYHMLPIPDNIGGRFSVLTAVGLLPMAIEGTNIEELLNGANDMYRELSKASIEGNISGALQYALIRHELYKKRKKKIELLTTFHSELKEIQAWWQQLFAESEGKEKKGLYPAIASFSQDLHSIGQWIQDGDPTLFETFLCIDKPEAINLKASNTTLGDSLDYLVEKTVVQVNEAAETGTIQAHNEAGVPIVRIAIEKIDAYHLGALLYFFQVAVTLSAQLLDVNPFDQPGVEAYKHYMKENLFNKSDIM